MKTALKAKMIVPVAGPALRQGTLVFCDGKIADILPGHDVPFDGPVIDAKEDWVYPGFIDASSHLGVNKEPFDYLSESWDGADASAPLSPELLAADAFDPFSPALDAARAAGLTTCYAAAGHGAVIDGQGVAFKLRRAERSGQMCIPGTEQMHFCLGEPAMLAFKARQQPPMTRMRVLALLKKELDKAAAADAADDPGAKALRRVLAGEMKARFYCLGAQDIDAALALAECYGMDCVIDGAYESWKLPRTLREKGCPIVLNAFPFGPMQNLFRDRYAYRIDAPGALAAAGCPVALTADSVTNTKMLPYLAGFAVAHGLSPQQALEAITIVPARILGLAHRVGSLEKGKDADFALFSGDALLSTSRCRAVYVEGERVYQMQEED